MLHPTLCRLTVLLSLTLQPAAARACATRVPNLDDGASISVGRFTDQTWVPVEAAGVPVPDAADMVLSVAFDGKVTGRSGCNIYGGQAGMDAGYITFCAIHATEMGATSRAWCWNKPVCPHLPRCRDFPSVPTAVST